MSGILITYELLKKINTISRTKGHGTQTSETVHMGYYSLT